MDPIGDLITRIRNAILAGKSEVILPSSKFKRAVLEVIFKYGYINEPKEKVIKGRKYFVLDLKGKQILHIKRLSTPGHRIYVSSSEIPKPLSGMGLVVISTSSGVISGREAKKKSLGGELICEVW